MNTPVNPRNCWRLGGLSEEIELFECLALGVDRNHLVPTGGIDGSVAQPLLNHRDIDSGQQQMAGRGVAPEMDGVESFMFERWRLGACLGQIALTKRVESGAGEAHAALVDEEEIAVRELRNPPLRFQIGTEKGQGGIPQGDRARLVALGEGGQLQLIPPRRVRPSGSRIRTIRYSDESTRS